MKKRNPGEKSKFFSYFDLWDAFQEPGCAICTLIERCSFNFLDALLYERVNDVGTRVRLRESLGFCNWHAWKCLEVSNCSLGLGIIHEDILGRIEELLKKVKNSFPFRISLLGRLLGRKKTAQQPPYVAPDQRCPVCENIQFFESFYLGILLDFMGEEDFAKRYRRSSGTCFPHMGRAMEKYPSHANLPLLIERQIEKYGSLRGELAEFIRKQDYQYANEPRGLETDSWKRALEMVAGKREIFSGQKNDKRIGNSRPIDDCPSNVRKEADPEESPESTPNVAEKLKFENDRLRRNYADLKEEFAKESNRASSLQHIAWKMSEDNKILKMGLEEAKARAREYAEQIDHLKKEVERSKAF